MEVEIIPHREAIARGILYAFKRDKVEKLLDNLLLSNGLAWSPDGKTLYFIDSYQYRIDCFDYDGESLFLSKMNIHI